MNMKILLLTTASLVSLSGCGSGALASSANTSHSQKYCYQPCVTSLSGITKATWTYGPPNFGDPKTDRKIAITVLVLDSKIDIRASDLFDAAKDVSEVQLYFPVGNPQIANGQHVMVVGKLQGATTAADIEPIVMKVSVVQK